MKYIVFKRTWYSLMQELPIIFPIELNHKQIFDSVKTVDGMEGAVLVSAGFLNIMHAPHCFGNSDSLHVTSRRSIDANMIKNYVNNRGLLTEGNQNNG